MPLAHKDMAIDTKSVSQLIAEFRKLQAKDTSHQAGTGDRIMSRYTLHIIAFRDTDLSPVLSLKKKIVLLLLWI